MHKWIGRNLLGYDGRSDNMMVYKKGGNDIFVGFDGLVKVYCTTKLHGPGGFSPTPYSSIGFGYDDTNPVFVYRNSTNPIVREYVVDSAESLKKVSADIWNSGTEVDLYLVNVTNDIDFKPWSDKMSVFYPHYGEVIINGNNHKISLNYCNEYKEHHFSTVNKTSLFVNNLIIEGFNCGIMNYGVTSLTNVCFSNNFVICDG